MPNSTFSQVHRPLEGLTGPQAPLRFFIFTTVAAYTANLAAVMVQKASAPRIETLDQAAGAGMWLCGERKSISIIQLTYPSAKFVEDEDGAAGLVSRSDVFAKMDAGQCGAGILVTWARVLNSTVQIHE